MFNLGGNATKFTKEGHVSIQADLNRPNNQLILTVTDTGVGIPKDKHEQVFNSFETKQTLRQQESLAEQGLASQSSRT